MEKIKDIAKSIAMEISERSLFDVDRASIMIETRLNNLVPALLSEYKSNVERKIDELRDESIRIFEHDRQKYIKIGLQISKLKSDKAVVNRAMSAMARNDKLANVKEVFTELYGVDAWNNLMKKIDNDDE